MTTGLEWGRSSKKDGSKRGTGVVGYEKLKTWEAPNGQCKLK